MRYTCVAREYVSRIVLQITQRFTLMEQNFGCARSVHVCVTCRSTAAAAATRPSSHTILAKEIVSKIDLFSLFHFTKDFSVSEFPILCVHNLTLFNQSVVVILLYPYRQL